MDYLDFAVSLGLLFAGGLLKLSTLAGLVQCSFRRNCDIMAALPLFVYNAHRLRSLNVCSSKLRRATRKILFSFGLWRPSRQHQWTSKRIPSMLRQPELTHPNSIIRLAKLNVWSLREKYVPVSDIITANDLDVLAVTESFHSSSDDVAVRRAAPPGFSYLDRPRSDSQDAAGRGGGIVVYHKSNLSSKRLNCTRRRSRFKPSLSPSPPSEVLSPSWQSIVRVLLIQLRRSSRSSQPCWRSLQSITPSWS